MHRKRLIAGGIDFFIAAMIQALLMFMWIFKPLLYGEGESHNIHELNLLITAIAMLYLVLRDLLGRKSIGKRIKALTIVDTVTHHEAQAYQRLCRNVTWILGPVEVVILLSTQRRIGDILAHTEVVER